MKNIYITARTLLGAVFLVFGLNGFRPFIPVPHMAPAAEKFIMDLISTGYMLFLWKGTEVLAGVMLLVGLWVPFALVVLAPIIVNIFFFHLRLDPRHLPIGAALVILAACVAWYHRANYWPLFQRRLQS